MIYQMGKGERRQNRNLTKKLSTLSNIQKLALN